MSDDEDFCTCPASRPLGMPHLDGCPEKAAEVLVFRQPETGRPVAVPQEVVSEVERAYEAYQQRIRRAIDRGDVAPIPVTDDEQAVIDKIAADIEATAIDRQFLALIRVAKLPQ